jgi:Leucine-rich repeat (LRR) protein
MLEEEQRVGRSSWGALRGAWLRPARRAPETSTMTVREETTAKVPGSGEGAVPSPASSPSAPLRPTPHRGALLVAVAVVLVLSITLALTSRLRARLDPAWGLPADLASRQEQLTELRLPPTVDRVDWLAPNLRTLSLAQTEVSSLRGLPSRLRELDLSNSGIASLKGIPAPVVTLDLSWTRVEDLAGLPPNLRSLSLGGRRIQSLEGLPATLRELSLRETRVGELQGLPPLEVLTLTGTSFESLEGIPSSLRSLTLEGTLVRSLEGLPGELQSLSLANNSHLSALGRLPDSVSRLETDHLPLPPLENLYNLKRLSVRLLGREIRLPRTISKLTLDLTSDVGEDVRMPLPEFLDPPLSLHSLALLNAPAERVPALPASLKSLDLTWFRGRRLPHLPASLRELSLRWSNVDSLVGLPSSLQQLDLSASGVRTLNGLPANLRSLRFQWFPLAAAAPLPPRLERLDLSGSETLRKLSQLPSTLLQLDVSQTELEKLEDLGTLTPNLRRLDISNTRIRSLVGLSSLRRLESLTLHAGQVASLEGMPPSVRSLSFVAKISE